MPKLMIYYNPEDNQVMAFNTHAPNDEDGATTQASTGYVPASIINPDLVKKFGEFGRDCKVVFTTTEGEEKDGSTVTSTKLTDFMSSTNPEPLLPRTPREDPRDVQIAALEARIAALESV